MMNMEEKKRYIRNKFPQLERVTRQEWAEAACEIWAKAWEKSAWEDIEEIAANPITPTAKFINHVRFVVESCVQVGEMRKAIHGDEINMDYLILGAVLHDVSKILEYEPKEGGGEKLSSIGELYQHGFFGAIMAMDYGLPEEVVHIISMHPPTMRARPKMLEDVILHYCDLMDVDMNRFRDKAPLWMTLPIPLPSWK